MGLWSVERVSDWLRAIGFEKYVKRFKDLHIDGDILQKLQNQNLRDLLIVINEDGTTKSSSIMETHRFRQELWYWNIIYEQRNKKRKPFISQMLKTSNQTTLPTIEHVGNNQYRYIINNDIHVQFFKNPQFASYLLNCIQQESSSIQINIQKVSTDNEHSSCTTYTIEFMVQQQQHATHIGNIIERIFKSIRCKIYRQTKVTTWLSNPRAISLIQSIMDGESNTFTVCRVNDNRSKVLEIYYFCDEKFNGFENKAIINHVIHNSIIRIVVVLQLKTTRKGEKQYAIQFDDDLNQLIKQYDQENEMISVTQTKIIPAYEIKDQRHIQIFGHVKLVNIVLEQIQNLKSNYSIKRYQLDKMTTAQVSYLDNACRFELKKIRKEFRNARIQFNFREHEFDTLVPFKDAIESRIKALLSSMKTSTFQTAELYYDIAHRASSVCKFIAHTNLCNCDIKIEETLKPCIIPRAFEATSMPYTVSKSTMEQSNLFCSSVMVHREATLANGSLKVFIGDIVTQQVDTIVIASESYGLKESLIERAGDILLRQTSTKTDQQRIPFITETTAGRLNCKRILFVNWSLPKISTANDEENVRKSIQQFISKVIQYIVVESQFSTMSTQSVAFSVPDSYNVENIIAEEMISETQRQLKSIKSPFLNVSFIVSLNQSTLYQAFSDALSIVQANDNRFGVLLYPSATMTMTLTSFSDAYLAKCQEKIKHYLKRCMMKIELDGFHQWNQYSINAYYKYCNDSHILPVITNDQYIVLNGSITAICEAKQKYQQINALIKQKICTMSFENYNIVLSCSRKDYSSVVPQHLANRLKDEGFSVSIGNDTLSCIEKSSCVVLCISENYFEDKDCQTKAKYASQISKPIIIIKIENCMLVDWLRDLLVDHVVFPMFGSKRQFDLVFDRLLLEIKKDNISLTNSSSHKDTILTLEFTEDEKQMALENIQDIIRDISNVHLDIPANKRRSEMQLQICLNTGILAYKRWVNQLTNARTKQNVAPSTKSGDINDAPFPMFHEVLYDPWLLLRHYTRPFSVRQYWQNEKLYLIAYSGPSVHYNNYNRTGSLYYDTNPFRSILSHRSQYHSWSFVTDEDIRKRQEMVDSINMVKRRRQIADYFLKNYRYVTEERLRPFLDFAQRMKDNANELTNLCETSMRVSTEASFTAIFSSFDGCRSQETPIPTLLISKSKLMKNSCLHNRNCLFQIII